jgi:predicted phage baseplate assembly protein
LGDGDGRLSFQTFKIPKSPLTYLRHAGESPSCRPELQITVNGRIWTRVEDFFERRPTDEVYVVREDSEGASWVQFGDGKSGARLPSGFKNVKALYRTGSGAFGALKPGTKPQAGGKLDGLDKIHMPAEAKGGSKPEASSKAREAAPGRTQSLDRLVSLQDIEYETLSVAGVRKASAAWKAADIGASVVVTVLMESGREAEYEEVAAFLNEANRRRGPARFPIQIAEGKRTWVCLRARFALQPGYLAGAVREAVVAALGAVDAAAEESEVQGLFSLDQRRFGQWEFARRIAAIMQNVKGVSWAEVDAFRQLGVAEDPATIIFEMQGSTPPDALVDCPPDRILCLYKGHLRLEVVKGDSALGSG